MNTLIKQAVTKVLSEASLKQQHVPFLMKMNRGDRKTIKYWHIRDEGNVAAIELYSNFVNQGMLEYITEWVDRNRGMFHLYPYKELICIELRVPKGKEVLPEAITGNENPTIKIAKEVLNLTQYLQFDADKRLVLEINRLINQIIIINSK